MESAGRTRILAVATTVAVALVACATTPYTNRSQLILVSDADSARLGAQAFQEVLRDNDLVASGPAVDQVRRVGGRIAAASGLDTSWQFAVIDDDRQQNAFALPGGKVAVYTGILPITKDDTGLAVVLGHEVGHVIARHGAERMSQGLAAQLGGAALSIALGGGPASDAAMAAYGLGAEYGVLRPFGRDQESEADEIGLILMAKAGYDPREAVGFWERMSSAGGNGGAPEFLSTHPSHATRIADLRAKLPAALQYYQPAGPGAAAATR